MDPVRTEVLQEMARNGRGYSHEIKSLAAELIERRAGKDPYAHEAFSDLEFLVLRAIHNAFSYEVGLFPSGWYCDGVLQPWSVHRWRSMGYAGTFIVLKLPEDM